MDSDDRSILLILGIIFGTFIVVIFIFSMVSVIHGKAIVACVEAGGSPLECDKALG